MDKHQATMTIVDVGKGNSSPSSALMELVDVDHLADFDQVVEFLKLHTDNVIKEVHGFDKLLLDNGKTQLNAPPAPEASDSHGGELLRTLSEKEGQGGITLKREFKVHALGPDAENPGMTKVEVREDIVGPDGYKENKAVISILRK